MKLVIQLLIMTMSTAFAIPMPKGHIGPAETNFDFDINDDHTEKYLIGEEWGKVEVNDETLSISAIHSESSKRTARLGGGTSFLIGKFAGSYVMATNHHVCPRSFSCRGRTIQFPLIKKNFRVIKQLGTWPTIDLAMVVIDVKKEDEALLDSLARNFDFKTPLYKGQNLLTVGFGLAFNDDDKMMINFDSDCKVFSPESRLIDDPDGVNPADYQAWSFPLGCDISHGDSGSSIVDRKTGAIVGIVWTGGIPKAPKVRTSQFLKDIFYEDSEEMWNTLSYAVPATRMKSYLETILDADEVEDENTVEILRSVLH